MDKTQFDTNNARMAEISRNLYGISRSSIALANSLTEQRLRAEYVDLESQNATYVPDVEEEPTSGE